jgi:hypothetical protein
MDGEVGGKYKVKYIVNKVSYKIKNCPFEFPLLQERGWGEVKTQTCKSDFITAPTK